MAVQIANQWLDAQSDDDIDVRNDTDDAEAGRGVNLPRRSKKRRRLNGDDSGSSSAESSDGEAEIGTVSATTALEPPQTKAATPVLDDRFSSASGMAKHFEDVEDFDVRDDAASLAGTDDDEMDRPTKKPRRSDSAPLPKELTSKHLSITAKTAKRSGVIYLSRIPPFMKPSALRSLLSPYAPSGLNRIFLTPESPETYSRRKRGGGNKKRSFVDGWVEFLRKREAKACVELLNGQIVGGKKGGWYHDDVWSMKYLRTFKWSDLVESISNENAERNARMRAEIAQSTKANREYVGNVEKAKRLEGMQRKRALAAGGTADGDGDPALGGRDGLKGTRTTVPDAKVNPRHVSHFRQNAVKIKTPMDKSGEQPEQVRRVLSKIF